MSARRASALVVVLLSAAVSVSSIAVMRGTRGEAEWPGVDEAVIGHFVEAAGQVGPAFSITWVHGDLLLFMFLCAGLCAGFVLGFYARSVFVEQRERAPHTGEHP